jgi:hypothetical protein
VLENVCSDACGASAGKLSGQADRKLFYCHAPAEILLIRQDWTGLPFDSKRGLLWRKRLSHAYEVSCRIRAER